MKSSTSTTFNERLVKSYKISQDCLEERLAIDSLRAGINAFLKEKREFTKKLRHKGRSVSSKLELCKAGEQYFPTIATYHYFRATKQIEMFPHCMGEETIAETIEYMESWIELVQQWIVKINKLTGG